MKCMLISFPRKTTCFEQDEQCTVSILGLRTWVAIVDPGHSSQAVSTTQAAPSM